MINELSDIIKDGWEKKSEIILSNLEYELKTLKYSRDTIETDIKRAIV